MAATSKQEADAYDRVIDAAAELAELFELSEIKIDENDLEKLTIYLARNSYALLQILETRTARLH
jgi:uncharacterized protein